jgi:peptidyl-dipeptidase Dcp
LLTRCNYASLSGTNVYRDFVELPSQFNENYMTEKEFLDSFAKNYQTGEPIPQELVNKIIASSQFGAAYSCMRQLSFGYVDMAWHSLADSTQVADPIAFERAAMEQVRIFPNVDGTATSPQFSHIFSGGYAAGYYSYKWAEVLDADAFAKFKANGIFDRKTADEFRHNILEKGGTEAPDVIYRRFRGQDPSIDALLIRDGIKSPDAPATLLRKN